MSRQIPGPFGVPPIPSRSGASRFRDLTDVDWSPTDGQLFAYDLATDKLIPVDPVDPGATQFRDLTDVNWVPPTDGQVFVYDSMTDKMKPIDMPIGVSPLTTKGDVWGYDSSDARIPIGSDGQVLTVDSGETLGLKWADSTGGGGVAHSYLGYNTIGGSVENMTQYRQYMKLITLSADGFLASIAAHVKAQDTSHAFDLIVAVLTDNAGTPDLVVAYDHGQAIHLYPNNTTARWLTRPIGVWLTAADYWIAVMTMTGGLSAPSLAYDGSGSDKYETLTGAWFGDGAAATINTSSNKYSIRASILS